MEGSVDQLTTRHSKYGLVNGLQEQSEEEPSSQNGAAEGEGAEGRKHMSAHERRLQKKKVRPDDSPPPENFHLFAAQLSARLIFL